MSTVAETMTTTTDYFDPSQEKTNTRLAKGVYPVHIIKCDTAIRSVKNKYKACIYNFVVKVDTTAKTRAYQVEDIDGTPKSVSGAEYVGREIRSQGVFRFLAPEVGDDFEGNPGGNRKFMETAEALGNNCPDIEVEVDGEKRTVKGLPTLDAKDFLGKPVLANVDFGKPWKGKDGVERTSLEVKSINLWKDGTEVDVELEELPF